MTTVECITALFCEVDEQLRAIPKHPEARLWPSEVVTLGLLHALKGIGNRAFYRWLTRDYRTLFPRRKRFSLCVFSTGHVGRQGAQTRLETPQHRGQLWVPTHIGSGLGDSQHA